MVLGQGRCYMVRSGTHRRCSQDQVLCCCAAVLCCAKTRTAAGRLAAGPRVFYSKYTLGRAHDSNSMQPGRGGSDCALLNPLDNSIDKKGC